uniref:Homeobox domain-containing protein n=1 Tax=Prolemur simus TaxID=1328070 RepID=A0A8C9AKW8_PROSS
MAKPQHYRRRPRTQFTPEQLRVLEAQFTKTTHPGWDAVQALASRLHLEESVIQTWFKNQCAKRRKLQRQQQTQPSASSGASAQPVSEKEEETPFPTRAANPHPTSPGISDAFYHNPQEPYDVKTAGGTGVSMCNSSRDSLHSDIEQIDLGDSDPPWASIPYEIEDLVELYALPGEVDPSTWDQYLFPVILGYGQHGSAG